MTFDPTAQPPQTGLVPGGPNVVAPQQPARTSVARAIAPNVEQTDFNDDSVRKYEFELYSGKKDTTDRIYIPAATPVKARTHFLERGAVKFSIICRSVYTKRPDGSGEDLTQEGQCCKLFGPSTPRWAVLIIQYQTDRSGQIVRPFTMFRKLWKFGADKYQQIRNVGKDFPLELHDLSVYCTPDGEQYQKLQIGAKPDCFVMHPQFPEQERKNILEWAKANISKLPRELGRSYQSDADMMRDLQQSGILTAAGPAPTMVADQPVTNFEDIITTPITK